MQKLTEYQQQRRILQTQSDRDAMLSFDPCHMCINVHNIFDPCDDEEVVQSCATCDIACNNFREDKHHAE